LHSKYHLIVNIRFVFLGVDIAGAYPLAFPVNIFAEIKNIAAYDDEARYHRW